MTSDNNSGRKRRNGGAASASRPPKAASGVQGGSVQANRIAIAVLEVLAGERTPADAAEALGVSLPRYYQLEVRAINGLVAACEPRPRGGPPTPDKRIAQLERALAQAQREAARQQTLVRAAHRSLGLKAAPDPAKPAARKAGGRRERRPTVRALKAVAALQKNASEASQATLQPAGKGSPASGEAPDQGKGS